MSGAKHASVLLESSDDELGRTIYMKTKTCTDCSIILGGCTMNASNIERFNDDLNWKWTSEAFWTSDTSCSN